jgi:hypothetical protein
MNGPKILSTVVCFTTEIRRDTGVKEEKNRPLLSSNAICQILNESPFCSRTFCGMSAREPAIAHGKTKTWKDQKHAPAATIQGKTPPPPKKKENVKNTQNTHQIDTHVRCCWPSDDATWFKSPWQIKSNRLWTTESGEKKKKTDTVCLDCMCACLCECVYVCLCECIYVCALSLSLLRFTHFAGYTHRERERHTGRLHRHICCQSLSLGKDPH